jgi:hypothetical protein
MSQHGWAPACIARERPLYVRDPIVHSVDRFSVDSRGRTNRSATDFVNLGGLNYQERNFRRRKGVVEYADLTHLYNARANPEFKSRIEGDGKAFHSRSSEITQYAEDAVMNKEMNPFRVGR